MKRFHVISLVLFLLLSNIYATDPITESDYLIITHTQLDQGSWLADLIALQEGRGFLVGTQYVQDGITTSDDIRNWIYSAYTTGIPIEYVLLVGAGADFIASPIVDPHYPETKSDDRYSPNRICFADSLNFIPFCYEEDVVVWGPDTINIPTDDPYIGWPDAPLNVAIGRIPAVSSAEMQIFVSKLLETYEHLTEYADWKNREIMVSQNVTETNSGCVGQKVDWMYDEILVYVPSDVDTIFLRSSELDPDCAWHYMCGRKSYIMESAFEDSVNGGAGLLHYFGTGASPYNLGNFYWAQDHVPYGSDFNFSNSGKYPFFMAVSCNLGKTQEPFTSPSVMKDLMFVASGGILGAFAPTILTTQWACREFSKDFHRLLNVRGINVTGKLTKQTKEEFEPRMPARVWVSRGFVLYGDPSMPLSLYQYKDSDITENTTWQGSIVVKNPITVQAGMTLTIKPGTGIFFEPGALLKVYGDLDAQGTTNFPIVFSRTDPNSQDNRYWDGIWVYSGGTFDLDHIEVRGARFGLHTSYASGSVTNSLFEEDYFATYLYHSGNVTLNGNSFNNNRYGSYISYSSSPLVESNQYSENFYGIKLSRSSPTIVDNIIENAQYDGLYCSNQSSPAVWTSRPDDGSYPEFNNVFSNNTRSGVYVSSNSTPNLGSYFWKPGMDHLGGFNHFTRGSGSYDIKSYSSTTITAEANWWDNMNNYGSVDVLPTAESIFGPLPLERSTGGGADEADSLLSEAYRLEADSAHSDAIALFNAIITINPDDSLVYAAVSGLVRNYRFLDNAAVLLDNIDNIHQQYGQSLAGTVAYDYSVSIYSGEREFDEALARSEEVIGTYESQDSDDDAAWALFEQALIYGEMSGTSLGRVTSESELTARADQCYEQILNDYSSTEAAYFLRELLGEEHPTEVVSVPVPERFSLNSAYPNPFNPTTTIRYELPQDAHVTMIIYDVLGRQVRRLVDSHQPAGYKRVVWDGKDSMGNLVASGVYIYRISAGSFGEMGNFVSSKKLLLLR